MTKRREKGAERELEIGGEKAFGRRGTSLPERGAGHKKKEKETEKRAAIGEERTERGWFFFGLRRKQSWVAILGRTERVKKEIEI